MRDLRRRLERLEAMIRAEDDNRMSAEAETASLLAPDGTPLTWHCHRCQRPLGEVVGPAALRTPDGEVFDAGTRRLVVTCRCGFRNYFWRPVPRPIDKRATTDAR